MNHIVLIGRLTRDPELRYTPNGVAVATFDLAVDRPQQADREKETDFIDIVVWQKLAETCANYLGKGRLIAVEGRLQTRTYEDKEGIRRKVAEVVANDIRFLDSAKDKRDINNNQQQQSNNTGFTNIEFNPDDIPFD
jgi:single-strand DNA-binding protein